MIMYSISQASQFLGVSIPTLQRWDKHKKLIFVWTKGNRRRYTLEQLQRVYGISDTDQDISDATRGYKNGKTI